MTRRQQYTETQWEADQEKLPGGPGYENEDDSEEDPGVQFLAQDEMDGNDQYAFGEAGYIAFEGLRSMGWRPYMKFERGNTFVAARHPKTKGFHLHLELEGDGVPQMDQAIIAQYIRAQVGAL